MVPSTTAALPRRVKEGAAPPEPTQGRLTATPSVTETEVGGARMMTSPSPRDVPIQQENISMSYNIKKQAENSLKKKKKWLTIESQSSLRTCSHLFREHSDTGIESFKIIAN
jgi:hypothetical protein